MRCIGQAVQRVGFLVGMFLIALRMSFRETVSYHNRAVFAGWFFVQVVGYLGQYGILALVVNRFGHLNGWTVSEILFLYSLNLLSYSLAGIFTIVLWQLDERIADGSFDAFLTRPVAPLAAYIAHSVNVPYLPHIVLSLSFIVISLNDTGVTVDAGLLIWLLGTVFGASLIQGSIVVALASVAFWTYRSRRLIHVVIFQLREFSFYPLSVFGRIVQVVFTFVIPYAFVSYYPARYLLDKQDGLIGFDFALSALVVGCVCTAIALIVWRLGLQAYSSTGA